MYTKCSLCKRQSCCLNVLWRQCHREMGHVPHNLYLPIHFLCWPQWLFGALVLPDICLLLASCQYFARKLSSNCSRQLRAPAVCSSAFLTTYRFLHFPAQWLGWFSWLQSSPAFLCLASCLSSLALLLQEQAWRQRSPWWGQGRVWVKGEGCLHPGRGRRTGKEGASLREMKEADRFYTFQMQIPGRKSYI